MTTFFERLHLRKQQRWARHTFLVPSASLEGSRQKFLYYTTATTKFFDTRIGGNIAFNTPPAFTRFADLPIKSQALDSFGRNASDGMGAYYSEALDDNLQLIHLQFGVPSYSGMVSFFTGFYNGQASYMAHTGRSPGIAYYAGRAATFIGMLTPGMILLQLTALAIRFLAMEPSTKYYTIKPAMGHYWLRANTIANIIGTNKKMIEPLFEVADPMTYRDQPNNELNNEGTKGQYRNHLHNLAPDIFDTDGSIDVMSIATRAQRIANKHLAHLEEVFNSRGEIDDMLERFRKYEAEGVPGGNETSATALDAAGASENPNATTGGRYFDEWTRDVMTTIGDKSTNSIIEESIRGQFVPLKQGREGVAVTEIGQDGVGLGNSNRDAADTVIQSEQKTGFFGSLFNSLTNAGDQYYELFKAYQRDGAMWLSLAVEYTGAHSTTFTNQTGEPEIKQKFDSGSQSAREARFAIQDGKSGISVVDGFVNAVKDVISGAMDQASVSGLMALGGSALVDIQNVWKDSSVELPSSTFTIKCRPWSGDPYTVFMEQDLLLSLILAAALPLSTGASSYTAPYYCSLFSQGKFKISEGMITSLSVSRATSNVSNTDGWQDLGLDISFTVTDMSSIVHAPITDSFQLLSPVSSITNMLNNEGAFLDWLAAYSGQSMQEVYYNSRRITNVLTRLSANVRDRFSAETQLGLLFDNSLFRATVSAFAYSGVRSVDN